MGRQRKAWGEPAGRKPGNPGRGASRCALLTLLSAFACMAWATGRDGPIPICGNDISSTLNRIHAGMRSSLDQEQRRFAGELDALLARDPRTGEEWNAVFALCRKQTGERWPLVFERLDKRGIEAHGRLWMFPEDMRSRMVERTMREANRAVFNHQAESLAAEPVRIISTDAMLVEGHFSLDTPRRLNTDARKPAENHLRFNRWGTRLQFEGAVLLDRVEFLLPEELADEGDVREHLLVQLGLDELATALDGRKVVARPLKPHTGTVHLDWIEIGWKEREAMVPITGLAAYGRVAERYPHDLRPAAITPEQARSFAADWIAGRYANRLKNRAARHLVAEGALAVGMEQTEVIALLGKPTRTAPGGITYETPAKGQPEAFRLRFDIGDDGRVRAIRLAD